MSLGRSQEQAAHKIWLHDKLLAALAERDRLAADLAREREERSLDQAEKEATLELARHWKEQADKCDTTALSLRCKELRQGLDAERERAEQAERVLRSIVHECEDIYADPGVVRGNVLEWAKKALGRAGAGKETG